MCGIAGAFGIRDDAALVDKMSAALRHRGPDGVGRYSHGERHLAATRLAIIDPGAGTQPIYNETGQLCLVFNGEIYNHAELRANLERSGHTFKTRTDTEVIVHLYEELGDECVRQLHGMFAFALLDGDRLLLARDRLGIKPLHFAFLPESGVFLFASEIKAILREPAYAPRLDRRALADTIALGHMVGDQTLFEGVRSLLPGHTMAVSLGERVSIGEPRRYDTRDSVRDPSLGLDEALERLEAVLARAVETHLAADVEVGLTLSGGLDSSILAAFAAELAPGRLRTFAVADHEDQADVVQARRVAERIGSDHRTVLLSFEDYLEAIPALIASEEQPSSSLAGMPFYLLCRVIAGEVKVTLHGEGADELFGGYTPYLDRRSRLSHLKERLSLLRNLGVAPNPSAVRTIRRLSAGSFDQYLEELFDINMAEPLERQHLIPVDKSSMAAGVETRVPYVDDAVVEVVRSFPLPLLVRPDLGVRKYILRRLALQRFGLGMTDAVLRQKYGVPTAGLLHLDRFDRLCNEALSDDYVTRHEFGQCFRSKRELVLFDLFLEIFLEHRGDSAAVGSVLDFVRSRDNGRGPRWSLRSDHAPTESGTLREKLP
jgi:asparagine synthase (glutamine-hydrolysing)